MMLGLKLLYLAKWWRTPVRARLNLCQKFFSEKWIFAKKDPYFLQHLSFYSAMYIVALLVVIVLLMLSIGMASNELECNEINEKVSANRKIGNVRGSLPSLGNEKDGKSLVSIADMISVTSNQDYNVNSNNEDELMNRKLLSYQNYISLCSPYSFTSDTQNGKNDYQRCYIKACPGDYLVVSTNLKYYRENTGYICGNKVPDTAGQYSLFKLFDYNGYIVAFNDYRSVNPDTNPAYCIGFRYAIPVTNDKCYVYELRQSCANSNTCSGTAYIQNAVVVPDGSSNPPTPVYNSSTGVCPSFSVTGANISQAYVSCEFITMCPGETITAFTSSCTGGTYLQLYSELTYATYQAPVATSYSGGSCGSLQYTYVAPSYEDCASFILNQGCSFDTISCGATVSITYSDPRPTLFPTANPSILPSYNPTSNPSINPKAPTTRPSANPIESPTVKPSSMPTIRPSATPSLKPSPRPSANPSLSPSSRPSLNPSAKPTAVPSLSPSPKPSAIPTIKPSAVPTCNPSSRPTANPSTNPTARPSIVPSAKPSANPSVSPSSRPSMNPTAKPSHIPTNSPSPRPTVMPSTKPSARPSTEPSAKPSTNPSVSPSSKPSVNPSARPSAVPSVSPTPRPSANPTTRPSAVPSLPPSPKPSVVPTIKPLARPSTEPSARPSATPSVSPSPKPSANPTVEPSGKPIAEPTPKPTKAPIARPTAKPSALPTEKRGPS